MMRFRRGKCRACGAVPSGASAITAPDCRDSALQVGVLRRIGPVEPARDGGDGAAGAERAPVRRAVDAPRQAGDDDEPGLAERGRQALGHALAVGRCVAAADQRDAAFGRERSGSPSTAMTGGASSSSARSGG